MDREYRGNNNGKTDNEKEIQMNTLRELRIKLPQAPSISNILMRQ